jgi:hypothetical protein
VISGTTINHNTANSTGGGINFNQGSAALNLSSTTLGFNIATSNGGGLYAVGSGLKLTATSSNFSGNSCGAAGGGIFTSDIGPITLTGDNIKSNIANTGTGGAVLDSTGLMSLTATNISGNKSGGQNGGLFVLTSGGGGKIAINGGSFNGNYASATGGIFVANGVTGKISGVTIKDNVSTGSGGNANTLYAGYTDPLFFAFNYGGFTNAAASGAVKLISSTVSGNVNISIPGKSNSYEFDT